MPDRLEAAVEQPLPERIADDCDAAGNCRAVVVRRQQASGRGRDPEHLEVITRHDLAGHARRTCAGGDREPSRCKAGHAGHRWIAAEVDEVGVGEVLWRRLGARRATRNPDQRGRMPDRRRLEQEQVHDREDRNVQPNPKRQDRQGREREARIPKEKPDRVPQVVDHVVALNPRAGRDAGARQTEAGILPTTSAHAKLNARSTLRWAGGSLRAGRPVRIRNGTCGGGQFQGS